VRQADGQWRINLEHQQRQHTTRETAKHHHDNDNDNDNEKNGNGQREKRQPSNSSEFQERQGHAKPVVHSITHPLSAIDMLHAVLPAPRRRRSLSTSDAPPPEPTSLIEGKSLTYSPPTPRLPSTRDTLAYDTPAYDTSGCDALASQAVAGSASALRSVGGNASNSGKRRVWAKDGAAGEARPRKTLANLLHLLPSSRKQPDASATPEPARHTASHLTSSGGCGSLESAGPQRTVTLSLPPNARCESNPPSTHANANSTAARTFHRQQSKDDFFVTLSTSPKVRQPDAQAVHMLRMELHTTTSILEQTRQQLASEKLRADALAASLAEEMQRAKELEKEVRLLQRDRVALEKKIKIDQLKSSLSYVVLCVCLALLLAPLIIRPTLSAHCTSSGEQKSRKKSDSIRISTSNVTTCERIGTGGSGTSVFNVLIDGIYRSSLARSLARSLGLFVCRNCE
jgi:hypothetical protein